MSKGWVCDSKSRGKVLSWFHNFISRFKYGSMFRSEIQVPNLVQIQIPGLYISINQVRFGLDPGPRS